MENLEENTSYSEFSVSGSTTDYELFCLLEIKNSFDNLLRINIRPNLNVVIQLGAVDATEEQCEFMKLYIQSLQIILQ